MPKSDQTLQMRFLVHRGVKYLRIEDVQEFLRTLGATEETDVRNRMNAAADNLSRSSGPASE